MSTNHFTSRDNTYFWFKNEMTFETTYTSPLFKRGGGGGGGGGDYALYMYFYSQHNQGCAIARDSIKLQCMSQEHISYTSDMDNIECCHACVCS